MSYAILTDVNGQQRLINNVLTDSSGVEQTLLNDLDDVNGNSQIIFADEPVHLGVRTVRFWATLTRKFYASW